MGAVVAAAAAVEAQDWATGGGSEMKFLIRKVPPDEQLAALVEKLKAMAEGVSALHEQNK